MHNTRGWEEKNGSMRTQEPAYMHSCRLPELVLMHSQQDRWVWPPAVQTDTWLQYQTLFSLDLGQVIRSIQSDSEPWQLNFASSDP